MKSEFVKSSSNSIPLLYTQTTNAFNLCAHVQISSQTKRRIFIKQKLSTIQHPIFFPFTRLNVPIIRVHSEHTRHQSPTENLPLPPRFKMHSTRPAASVDVLSQEQLWIPLWTAALKSQNTHLSASDLVKETARRKTSSTWEQSRNGNAQNIPLRYFC